MTEPWQPRSEVSMLGALGAELERASGRPVRRVLRGGRRTLAIAMLALLCAGGAAAAATGVLTSGDIIAGGRPSGPPENRKAVPQTVLAQGTAPVAGPWRMTSYGSEGVVDGDEVVEPPGLPCVELSLTAPPPTTPLLASSYCGSEIGRGFTSSSLAVKGAENAARTIVYGTAPEEAVAVAVTLDGSSRIPAQLFDGPGRFDGNLWAVSLGPGPSRATAIWLNPEGVAGGPPRDISSALDMLDEVSRFRGAP